MMRHKTLRVAGVIAMLFFAFKLGTIYQETEFYKRIDKCVKLPDNINMQEFYGHSFKGIEHTLWNHAKGHNASIYLDCIFEDLNDEH